MNKPKSLYVLSLGFVLGDILIMGVVGQAVSVLFLPFLIFFKPYLSRKSFLSFFMVKVVYVFLLAIQDMSLIVSVLSVNYDFLTMLVLNSFAVGFFVFLFLVQTSITLMVWLFVFKSHSIRKRVGQIN